MPTKCKKSQLLEILINISIIFPIISYAIGFYGSIISQKKVFLVNFFGNIFVDLLKLLLNYIFICLFRDSSFIYRPKNFPVDKCGLFKQSSIDLSMKVKSGREIGFPSGHSVSMGYFCAFWVTCIFKNHGNTTLSKIGSAIIILTSLFVTMSRVHINCHTYLQIITGYILGVLFGISWYSLIENYDSELVEL